MKKLLFKSLSLSTLLLSLAASAQMTGYPGEQVDADVALDRALKASSLTYKGKPFHAVMEIGSAAAEYSGRIEVWWVNETKYRVVLTSPKFSQEKIVNGDKVLEKNQGDYYPRWLENFVLAVLDPVPMVKNFGGRGGTVMLGPSITNSCLRRDDRPGNITDQMTWGVVCFSGSEPHLASVLTMNVDLNFKDWRGFGKKQIAHTIETSVLDYKPVTGKITVLDELKQPDEAMFAVSSPTPASERIATAFVSTLKEESLIETAPSIEWPPVREGKTEGYMIVYARTDRTGQVRETAKHNSDQPGLESYGMEQALRYKFKPLVVDGEAQQMEMPLVLHFSSRLQDPPPILSVEQMKKQMVSCAVDILPPGTPIVKITLSVNEKGEVTGWGSKTTVEAPRWVRAAETLKACRFAPYVQNGKATYYKGDVELTAP
jgi:hypothetical protein